MNKTSCIVTETNVHLLTDAELQEWNNAVDEYQQQGQKSENRCYSGTPRKSVHVFCFADDLRSGGNQNVVAVV
jgi:hypothetical protein